MSAERGRHHDDDLLRRLAELPCADVDPARAEQIRFRAHAELEAGSHSWVSRAEWVYNRVLEPALVIGVGGVYLAWAFRTASELLTR